jgi:hypothetical protein
VRTFTLEPATNRHTNDPHRHHARPIAATLPLGNVGYEPQTNAKGERLVWLEATVVDRLMAMRGSAEIHSDLILRLVELEAGRRPWRLRRRRGNVSILGLRAGGAASCSPTIRIINTSSGSTIGDGLRSNVEGSPLSLKSAPIAMHVAASGRSGLPVFPKDRIGERAESG